MFFLPPHLWLQLRLPPCPCPNKMPEHHQLLLSISRYGKSVSWGGIITTDATAQPYLVAYICPHIFWGGFWSYYNSKFSWIMFLLSCIRWAGSERRSWVQVGLVAAGVLSATRLMIKGCWRDYPLICTWQLVSSLILSLDLCLIGLIDLF